MNWKERPLARQEIGPAPGHEVSRLSLGVGAGEAAELAAALRELFAVAAAAPAGPHGELRLDLPRGWIVFWKLREGESRLLLAHPQQDEWVATAALTREHGALVAERLERLAGGALLNVGEVGGELGVIGSVSNVELVITKP